MRSSCFDSALLMKIPVALFRIATWSSKRLDDATAKKAGEIALEGANPLKDNGYKVRMAQDLIQRGLLASI